jgi:hypothetical protein
VPDARPPAPSIDAALALRGAACSRDLPCAPGLACLTGLSAFGGYCASACDATCDGACVGTPTGELCMAACTSDGDCRASEGYVCDPQWRACVMPNTTAIVPRACAAPPGIGRDLAFAPTTSLAAANEAAAVVMPDGAVLALHAAANGALAATRIDAQGRPPVTTPLGTGASPSIARDARTLYAVWQDTGVVLATSRDGTTWSEPKRLDACASCRAVVVTGGGAVHVVIASEGIRVRTSRDGGRTFGAPATIVAGGAANATAADGRLHVVAIESPGFAGARSGADAPRRSSESPGFAGARSGADAPRRWIDGGPLGGYGSAHHRVLYVPPQGRPITVSRRDEVLPFHFAIPSVAIDARRRWVYVAYVRGGRDAIWDLVLAASKDGGATWTRTRIGDGCAIHMVPALAVDPRTGRLHVTWYDSRSGRFAHATCGAGLTRCMQVGRLDDAPFGALSTVRRSANALGDATSLLVDDARRTLHAVWAQPVSGGKPRVVHAKAKLPLR